MDEYMGDHGFRRILSLEPLIREWKKPKKPFPSVGAANINNLEQKLARIPELKGAIEDETLLEQHQDLIRDLMSIALPDYFWETEAVAATMPMSFKPFAASPLFKDLLMGLDGVFQGKPFPEGPACSKARLMGAYCFVLKECFGIQEDLNFPITVIVEDKCTQLDRYFRLKPNFSFVQARSLGVFKQPTPQLMAFIREHAADPEVLKRTLPPENFELRGFELYQALDVTESEILGALERDLIDKGSVLSRRGFLKVQRSLRSLFRTPEITVDLVALENDNMAFFNLGSEKYVGGLFAEFQSMPNNQFQGSIYSRSMESQTTIIIRDLIETDCSSPRERRLMERGTRSLAVAPLTYDGKVIGALELGSSEPDHFGLSTSLLIEQITPFFSLAVAKVYEDVDNRIQAVIKEKCTAVHPSVEWRFRKAALNYLKSDMKGHSGELEPIVFNNVYSLYAASDIRGSSFARNKAIEEDLIEHLELAHKVLLSAEECAASPVLEQLIHRLYRNLEKVKNGLGSGDEAEVMRFLNKEVEPAFSLVQRFGPEVEKAIDHYNKSLDPKKRTVYRRRRDFEESVFTFNSTVSTYLDGEQCEAQSAFPHYFDKHKTDGVDYSIYIGASMAEAEDFNELHADYLRLWQLIVACGIGWHAERLKRSLQVGLDVTHLIHISHHPVAISFRFDEKRFDVDGTHNTGLQIIRSRLDKATVKGASERLTQPGKIAIVFSRQEEEDAIRLHLDFLRDKGFIYKEIESLELDQLPDVLGLKALRVEINLESEALADRAKHTYQKTVRRQTTHRSFSESLDGMKNARYSNINRYQGNPASLRTVVASFT